MTGERENLDVYFKSKRFLKRLDKFRSETSKANEISAYSLVVAKQMGMLHIHIDVIEHYLNTGEYKPGLSNKPPVYIIDRKRKIAPLQLHQVLYLRTKKKPDYIVPKIGVSLELSGEVSQPQIVAFIKNKENWAIIKESLNANYPKRKKLFKPIKRIDDYLTIADELNAITEKKKRSEKAAELANTYKMEIPDIYRTAKRFKAKGLVDLY
jgi:hypothetical protein